MCNEWPKGGEVYQAIVDIEVSYIIHHYAPVTHGAKCIFPRDGKLVVCSPKMERPLGVYCVPVDYERMEKILIPESDKSDPTYSNYSIFVDTEILETNFKKLS